MASARYSIDELVAALKRSQLANVVVEGESDVAVLRDFETLLRQTIPNIDFFVAGDKNAVLLTSTRDGEIKPSKASYLADSDLWLYTADRDAYPNVVFVDGYSIENSCISSPAVIALVNARAGTAQLWADAIRNLAAWFSSEVWFQQNGLPYQINIGIENVLDPANGFNLTAATQQRIAQTDHQQRTLIETQVLTNPLKFICGKMLVRTLKAVLRHAEHLQIKERDILAMGSKNGSADLTNLRYRIEQSFA